MNLTMEEISLLAAYGHEDRAALAAALRESLADFEEPEMRELAESAAAKLEGMTDAEFSALDRIPEFDFTDEDDDETEG